MNRAAADLVWKEYSPLRHPNGETTVANDGTDTSLQRLKNHNLDAVYGVYQPPTVAPRPQTAGQPTQRAPSTQATQQPTTVPSSYAAIDLGPRSAPISTGMRQLPPRSDLIQRATTQAPTADTVATWTEYPASPYNHGTWTAEEDKILIQARARGQNWADLQRTYFPSKTPNACRKRYERLVEKRGLQDASGRRLEAVANEYMLMRKQMWSKLADRVGLRWEVVEAMCMSAGLRTIQSNARAYSNRARREDRRRAREAQSQTGIINIGSLDLPPLIAYQSGPQVGTGLAGHAPGPPTTSASLSRPPLAPAAGNRMVNVAIQPPSLIDSPPLAGRLPPMPQASFGDGRAAGQTRPPCAHELDSCKHP